MSFNSIEAIAAYRGWQALEDDVPQEAKMARLHAIEQLEAGISSRINSRLLGDEVEVLVEGQKRRPVADSPWREPVVGPRPEPVEGPNSDGEQLWYGRSRRNKLVHFQGEARIGELVAVRIERASPWSLVGAAVATAVPAPA